MTVSLTGDCTVVPVQASDSFYSMVSDPQKTHHKDRDGHSPTLQQHHRPLLVGNINCTTQPSWPSRSTERFYTMALRHECRMCSARQVWEKAHPFTDWLCLCHLIPLQSRLEPPVDKTLTAVRSLNLDTRGVPIPRKNQVKMISSCPLPQADPEPGLEPGSGPGPGPGSSPKPSSSLDHDQMYSQITLPPERGTRKEKKSGGGVAPPYNPPAHPQEPEYSLPFDNIDATVMSNILKSSLAASADPAADPVYDSIDEMQIRNIFGSSGAGPTYTKAEHIYDEPEGCSLPASPPPSLYDDPEEVRGDAWKVMATTTDPKGHEFPYNPRVDDYAVPKRHQRAATVSLDPEEGSQGEEPKDSPYDNLNRNMM